MKDWLEIRYPCPRCKAEVGEHCRSAGPASKKVHPHWKRTLAMLRAIDEAKTK